MHSIAVAILAGDALHALAFELLADPATHADPFVRSELCLELARASGPDGMAGGQMMDLVAGGADMDLAMVTRLQQLKTGALFSFCLEAGAIMGKVPPEGRTHLRGYARNIGLAFQIVDDLIDVEGDAETAGKAVGKDAAAGKATFVSHLGADRAREQARMLVAQAIEHLKDHGPEADLLRDLARYIVDRDTFDPITLGHMDIIRRGAKLVDRLVIGVTTNPSKSPMFSLDERMAMVRREVDREGGQIEVVPFDSLLMTFAERQGASVIVRGLRAVADFEYEYQMAGMNQQLNDRIETVFLMADVSLQPIASRLVKEIAMFGGDVSKFVTAAVEADVAARVDMLGRKGS
jgi:pantetheine-phosphate adenylyltransferase